MRLQDLVALRVPPASLPLLLRLAKSLIRDAPKTGTETTLMLVALARLGTQIEEVEAAIVTRLRSTNPGLLARELEFDRAIDSLWVMFRELLELEAKAYGHPGLDFLQPERQQTIGLAKLRARAEAATELHTALFVPHGTAFTKARLPIQAEAMTSLLRLIKADGHDGSVATFLGPGFVTTLKTCQAEYDALVHTRMRRETGVSADFRELRTALSWRIDRYKTAVETLYDEDEPDSLEPILDALRTLILASKLLVPGQSSAAALEGELGEALVELDLGLDEANSEAASG